MLEGIFQPLVPYFSSNLGQQKERKGREVCRTILDEDFNCELVDFISSLRDVRDMTVVKSMS